MLPAFVSYILGEDPAGDAQAVPLPVRLWRAPRRGAVVTAAFVGVFAAVGLVFAYLSRAIVEVVPWRPWSWVRCWPCGGWRWSPVGPR